MTRKPPAAIDCYSQTCGCTKKCELGFRYPIPTREEYAKARREAQPWWRRTLDFTTDFVAKHPVWFVVIVLSLYIGSMFVAKWWRTL